MESRITVFGSFTTPAKPTTRNIRPFNIHLPNYFFLFPSLSSEKYFQKWIKHNLVPIRDLT